MPQIDKLGVLEDLVRSSHGLNVAGPNKGSSARAVSQQMRGLALAKQLGDIAKQLAVAYNAEICRGVKHGELLESTTPPAVVKVSYSPGYKAWRQRELREAVRPILLWDDEDNERTGEDVLDLLWNDETGLMPLAGGSMRLGVFRDRWKMDPEQFATKTDGESASFVAGKEALMIDLTKEA